VPPAIKGGSSILGRVAVLQPRRSSNLAREENGAGAEEHGITNPRVGCKTRRRFGERRLGLCSEINLTREARGVTDRHKGSS